MLYRCILQCCFGLLASGTLGVQLAAAQDVVDIDVATRRGLVSVDVESLGGAMGNRIKVRVQRRAGAPINVVVQPGLVLAPQGADVQRMAVVKLVGKYVPGNQYQRATVMVLADQQPHTFLLQAVCIDYHKSSPKAGQRYAVVDVDVRCQRILSAPLPEGASVWAYQSAIWMDRAGVASSELQRIFSVPAIEIQSAQKLIARAEQVGVESLAQVDVSADVRAQAEGVFSADPQVRVEAYRRVQGLSAEDRRKLQVLVDVNVLRNGQLPDASELRAANTLESLLPEGLNLPQLQIPESLDALTDLLQSLPDLVGNEDDDTDVIRFPRARLLPLMVGLRARRPAVRALTVRRVAQLNDPWAVDTLIVVLADPSPRVRQAAAEGLKQRTGQDFGEDAEQWRTWWTAAQDGSLAAPDPAAP